MFKTDVDYRNYFFFFEKSNMHGLLGTYTDYVNLRFSHIHDYLGSTIIRDSRVLIFKPTFGLLNLIYSTARTYPQNPEKSAFSATFSQLCTHARNMSRILYFCSYSSSLVKWAFFDSKSPIEFDGMRKNFSTLASEAVEANFRQVKIRST